MTEPQCRKTHVTEQQAVIHALFRKHRSMSIVARMLNLSQIRVREALVQHQRNTMRDQGLPVPPLKEMLRGDVTCRFGVARSEFGGRPAKHVQLDLPPVAASACAGPQVRRITVAADRVRRLVVTAVEPDAPVHQGFWANLQAYAGAVGADLAVVRTGSSATKGDLAAGYSDHVCGERILMEGRLDIAIDATPSPRLARPLDGFASRNDANWTIVPSGAVQLETMPRMRADGIRMQLTTGAMTVPANGAPGHRRELGAMLAEVTPSGTVHCRHLLAPTDGDGTFHDLDRVVSCGTVRSGRRVEALTFGDIHHIHLDQEVASATWGLGAATGSSPSLVDRLRPRSMVFHDVCDFDARNHHDARDHHRRFAQFAAGGGDVAAELKAAAGFIAGTRRDWSRSIVVGSNHDASLVRWLREADYREDPLNTIFFLESALALHRRLASGRSPDGFFEQILRRLSGDGLAGVRFLQTGESLKIGGVEAAIHGHLGADGRQGDVRFFDRLGIRATLGHTHRPTTRGRVYCTGVCQTELAYARGPITAWAVGHVVTYPTGARQHLIFNDGRFFA